MSIERVYHCDGPANLDLPEGGETHCSVHIRTAGDGLPIPFLKITGSDRPLHFCSWDCVLRYAAAKEPIQILSGDAEPD
jgi:hypothetical protein